MSLDILTVKVEAASNSKIRFLVCDATFIINVYEMDAETCIFEYMVDTIREDYPDHHLTNTANDIDALSLAEVLEIEYLNLTRA